MRRAAALALAVLLVNAASAAASHQQESILMAHLTPLVKPNLVVPAR